MLENEKWFSLICYDNLCHRSFLQQEVEKQQKQSINSARFITKAFWYCPVAQILLLNYTKMKGKTFPHRKWKLSSVIKITPQCLTQNLFSSTVFRLNSAAESINLGISQGLSLLATIFSIEKTGKRARKVLHSSTNKSFSSLFIYLNTRISRSIEQKA